MIHTAFYADLTSVEQHMTRKTKNVTAGVSRIFSPANGVLARNKCMLCHQINDKPSMRVP
jgi:hypothetical protein